MLQLKVIKQVPLEELALGDASSSEKGKTQTLLQAKI